MKFDGIEKIGVNLTHIENNPRKVIFSLYERINEYFGSIVKEAKNVYYDSTIHGFEHKPYGGAGDFLVVIVYENHSNGHFINVAQRGFRIDYTPYEDKQGNVGLKFNKIKELFPSNEDDMYYIESKMER